MKGYVPGPRRRGFTLMEVVVVMTIMGVLIAIPAPIFARAVEQSRLDVAAANLRAIWGAERYYFLEHGRFGTLAELAANDGGLDDLVDPTLASGGTYYRYAIAVGGDGKTFTATATHPGTPGGSGSITVDEGGSLAGSIDYRGTPLTIAEESAR